MKYSKDQFVLTEVLGPKNVRTGLSTQSELLVIFHGGPKVQCENLLARRSGLLNYYPE
jgi:hypothetical protein